MSARGLQVNGPKQWTPAATLLFSWLSMMFFLWPGKECLPAGAVSSVCFLVAPLVFSKRGASGLQLSPVTWMRFAFGLQLVLVPVCVRIAGPSLFLLSELPSRQALNTALLLDTAAYLAFCAGYQVLARDRYVPREAVVTDLSWLPTRRLSLLFVVLGCGGLLLKFGSVSHLVTYLTNPIEFLIATMDRAEEATLSEAAGTFLCAFFGFGFVMMWCRAVDLPRRQSGRWTRLCRFALIGVIALAYALMSYNRGSVAVPLVAVAAVVGKRQPGAALRYAVVIAGTLAVLLTALTLYRSANSVDGEQTGTAMLQEAGSSIDVTGMFQVYGQAPQFLAAALAPSGLVAMPLLGRTLVSSILSPLPLLGKPFRATSGMMLYNEALERGDAPDQIPQFTYELYRDLSLPGVLGGFSLIGAATAWLQRRFVAAQSGMEVYLLQYCGVWLGFLTVGSIDVIAQIAIYSAPPAYVYLLLRRSALRRGGVRAAALIFPGGSSI